MLGLFSFLLKFERLFKMFSFSLYQRGVCTLPLWSWKAEIARSSGNETMNGQVLSFRESKSVRYQRLILVYHADLYRYAYWLCHNSDLAQDLVQDTFERAWKSLDNLEDVNAAKGWLFTILRRENARRFDKKQFEYDDTELDELVADGIADPEQQLSDEKIRVAIAALPQEYKEPLMMQVVGGFVSEEIAEQLSLNINTVNTRLFRARAYLQRVFRTGKGA
jgi:RNA polymerase sigma-70 factor (ECF subfamily)